MKDKSSGIFSSWLQNFATLVFTQSFHAIFLVFVLKMMSTVSSESNNLTNINDGMLAIVSIAGSMAIIKLEKLIKQLFGINDSKFMGGLGANFAKTLGTVASGAQLARRTAEPFKKHKEVVRKRDKIGRELDELKSTTSDSTTPSRGTRNPVNDTVVPTTTEQTRTTLSNDTSNNSDGNADRRARMSDLISALDKNTQALNNAQAANNNDSKAESKEDKIAKLQKEYDELDAEAKVTTRQMFTRTGSTAAAAAFGLGASDDMGQMITVTNLVDAPLDMISDRRVKRNVYKNKSDVIEHKISEVRENIKRENPSIDASALEAAVKEATKDLQNLKISMDDRIPDGIRKNLAEVWKDVQRENTRNTSIRTRSNSDYTRRGGGSVDDI